MPGTPTTRLWNGCSDPTAPCPVRRWTHCARTVVARSNAAPKPSRSDLWTTQTVPAKSRHAQRMDDVAVLERLGPRAWLFASVSSLCAAALLTGTQRTKEEW